MKINRSSKIYFKKWLTQKKKDEINLLLLEYSKIVNYFIENYKNSEEKKFDLLLASHIQHCIKETGTWLTARMVKNAFSEGFGMLQSYYSNLKENPKHSLPKHTGRKATLSQTINSQYDDVVTKVFDFNVTLTSIGNKKKISIPLKKHKQFNKWNSLGKRAKTIILNKNW